MMVDDNKESTLIKDSYPNNKLSEVELREQRGKRFGIVPRPDETASGNNDKNREMNNDRNSRSLQHNGRFSDYNRFDQPSRKRHRDFSSDEVTKPSKRMKMDLDVVERTEIFKIESTERTLAFDETHPDLENKPVIDISRMSKAGYCPEIEINALWAEKTRLDYLFDSGREKIYYKIRDLIFPQDKKGSSRFANRAGDKLFEVHDAVDIFEGLKSTCFIDVCGGPGAFSQLLLDEAPKPSRGFGITLKVPMTPKSDVWYPQLEKHPRFTILYGADGTGNVYKTENLVALAKQVAGKDVNILVSDGGFKITKDEQGQHMENYQELYSGRIILSEFLAALKTLQPQGHFVCKMFDTFSHLSASIIYLTSQLFESAYIIKPLRSRIVNSERYLVGKFLKPKEQQFAHILSTLEQLHANCQDNTSPLSIVPINILHEDEKFTTSMRRMVGYICEKQTKALKIVMDKIDEEIKEELQ